MEHEIELQLHIRKHLLNCISRPEYYNYAPIDLVKEYKSKIEKIDRFLSQFNINETT